MRRQDDDDEEFEALSRLVFAMARRDSIPGNYPHCRSLRLPHTFHGDELCWAWRDYYERRPRPGAEDAADG